MSPNLPRELRSLTLVAVASLTAADRPASRPQDERPVTTTADAPGPTHLEAIAFDAARRRLVLFGGSRLSDTTWTDLNDTWEWDGRRWHAIPSVNAEPGARRGHALAYDPGERRVVLVGGVRTRAGSNSDDAFDDTWTYDGTRWERGPDASAMSGHGLVYDVADRTMLLLGYVGRETHDSRRLVIWRRTPTGWVFVDSTGPTLAGLVRAAYDVKRSVLVVPVLHGSTSRVWEWDGRRWKDVDAPGPSPRSRHALAYDHRTAHVILVGGRDNATRTTLGDVWAWDGLRWSMPPDGGTPEPRASAALVTDADSGWLLLYGGVVPPRGLVADLWVRSQSGWTQSHPAGPSPHQATTPAFTALRGSFIALSVGDLDASVRWYTEKLGLKVVMRPPKIEKSTAVILEGGGLIVELVHNEDAVPLSQAAPAITRNYLVHGIFKAGIVVDDFDKTIATLRARGAQIVIGPFPATAEQRVNAIIRDNAGNYIQFFGAR